jgi:DNA repair protein RecN (Recombination protein N)
VLEELHIRGLGVIDDATLPLGPGLTVVTGETGAGKTMVVTGLLLLFGGRADAARIRSGVEQASVDGRLELAPDSPAAQRAVQAGGDLDDGTGLVLRRTVSASGRSRAYVGGAPTPVGVLGELGERLLAVHGQSDQIRLTRPAEQRAALDRYADLDLSAYSSAYHAWRTAADSLAQRLERLGELRRESDLLHFGIAEIEAAEPEPGEDAELTALAARLAHADALRAAARAAHDALLGDVDDPAGDAADVLTLLGLARRVLDQQAGDDPELDALTRRLTDLSAVAADLGGDLSSYTEQIEADPVRLEQIEQRRAVLTNLMRKYADGPEPGVAGVLQWADQARARLAEIDVSDEAIAELTRHRDALAAGAARLAVALSARRREAAEQLSAAVTVELAGLAMSGAQLSGEVRPRPPVQGAPVLHIDGTDLGAGPDGIDDVEFLLRPHPDAPALPLGRGASGGELSRIMLALEVCLTGSDPVPTLVFDEVDAGVGGRAAAEVGRRLARLSRDHQVLAVTHLAQVAAFADRHVVVAKTTGGVTASDVRAVDGDERIGELARMLAGTSSDTAREHAAELLADAGAERAASSRRRAARSETSGRLRKPGKTRV